MLQNQRIDNALEKKKKKKRRRQSRKNLNIEDKKKISHASSYPRGNFYQTPADTGPIVVLLEYHHLPNAISHLIVTTSVAHQNLFLKLPITGSK